MSSFTGRILRVDLTARSSESVSVPPEVYEAVLAGKGLEAWYLYKHIPAGADPLGPENILAFAAGALCGTGAFLTGRWTVACKSPLTGGWGDANCGGLFAPAIKQCGYDAIFISGVSEAPVYLFCDGKGVELATPPPTGASTRPRPRRPCTAISTASAARSPASPASARRGKSSR